MPTTTPTETAEGAQVGATAWARIHGYARPVRVISIQRTRCWVAWMTSARCSRVSQIHIGELAPAPEPGSPISHALPPSLSHGLAALDCELSRRRLRAVRMAQRRAERAARVAS